MTALVQAEVDGERLLPEEIGAFFVLLSVAGNDTTRHTTSHAMRALTEFPDQRALPARRPRRARMPAAVEEFVRWASAVMTFRRTATRDTELSGQPIAAGDKVVMFYGSANRDEAAFDHPERFDVAPLAEPPRRASAAAGRTTAWARRSPARSCAASSASCWPARARTSRRASPSCSTGNFINGIKRMPCKLRSVLAWAETAVCSTSASSSASSPPPRRRPSARGRARAPPRRSPGTAAAGAAGAT